MAYSGMVLCSRTAANPSQPMPPTSSRRQPPSSTAARTARTKGSHAPYLPLVMELGYLCRLRGIETLNLTEAQETPDGIRTNRRKGSRDNVVAWSPRLRAVWNSAMAYRRDIIASQPGDAPALITIVMRDDRVRKNAEALGYIAE